MLTSVQASRANLVQVANRHVSDFQIDSVQLRLVSVDHVDCLHPVSRAADVVVRTAPGLPEIEMRYGDVLILCTVPKRV